MRCDARSGDLVGCRGHAFKPRAGTREPVQLYREIEKFRLDMKRGILTTMPAAEKSLIVRRWLNLLIDEGAFNPGGLYLFTPLPRSIEDGLDKTGDIDEAARKLDAFTESWHADGSLGNIREELWKTVEVQSLAVEGSVVRLKATAGERPVALAVHVYKGGTVHVTADMPGFFAGEKLEPEPITVADVGSGIAVKASWGEIRIGRKPYRLQVAAGGKRLWDEQEVQYLVDKNQVKAVRHYAKLVPEDHFYGFGERYRQLDYRGSVLSHWHSPSTPSIMRGKYADTYGAIAFTVNPRGMGLFWNSSYRGQFDLGASEPNVCKATFFGPVFDYYLFFDPSPLAILSRYTDVTGKPLVPPPWAFLARWAAAEAAGRWTARRRLRWTRSRKRSRKWSGLDFPTARSTSSPLENPSGWSACSKPMASAGWPGIALASSIPLPGGRKTAWRATKRSASRCTCATARCSRFPRTVFSPARCCSILLTHGPPRCSWTLKGNPWNAVFAAECSMMATMSRLTPSLPTAEAERRCMACTRITTCGPMARPGTS